MCPSPMGHARAPQDMLEPHGTCPSPMGHAQAPRSCPTTPGWTHLLIFAEVPIQLVEVGGTLGRTQRTGDTTQPHGVSPRVPPQPGSPGWSPQCRSQGCHTRSRPLGRTRRAAHTAPGDERQDPWHRTPAQNRSRGGHRLGPSAPHLAALAAQPVAAHGVVGQRALLAAVAPALGALLPGQQSALHHPQHRTSPNVTPQPRSPPACRSRTPLPPPRSRCRTPEGPGAVGTKETGDKSSGWGSPSQVLWRVPSFWESHPQGDSRTPKLIVFCRQGRGSDSVPHWVRHQPCDLGHGRG